MATQASVVTGTTVAEVQVVATHADVGQFISSGQFALSCADAAKCPAGASDSSAVHYNADAAAVKAAIEGMGLGKPPRVGFQTVAPLLFPL